MGQGSAKRKGAGAHDGFSTGSGIDLEGSHNGSVVGEQQELTCVQRMSEDQKYYDIALEKCLRCWNSSSTKFTQNPDCELCLGEGYYPKNSEKRDMDMNMGDVKEIYEDLEKLKKHDKFSIYDDQLHSWQHNNSVVHNDGANKKIRYRDHNNQEKTINYSTSKLWVLKFLKPKTDGDKTEEVVEDHSTNNTGTTSSNGSNPVAIQGSSKTEPAQTSEDDVTSDGDEASISKPISTNEEIDELPDIPAWSENENSITGSGSSSFGDADLGLDQQFHSAPSTMRRLCEIISTAK